MSDTLPAPVAQDSTLADLASFIRFEHEQFRLAAHKTVEHGFRVGEALLQAKRRIRHGRWGRWLGEHCDLSERTAQGYMRLARNRAAIEANPQALADLTIEGALQSLAKPKPEIGPNSDGEHGQTDDGPTVTTTVGGTTITTTVGTELESVGDLSTVDTRTDRRGRAQPSHKKPAPDVKAIADRAEERSRQTQRIAEQIQEAAQAVAMPKPDTNDDAWTLDQSERDNSGEIARKLARLDELENLTRAQERERRSLVLQLAAAVVQLEKLKTTHRFSDVTGKPFLATIVELDMPVVWTPEEIIADIEHPNLTPEHLRRAAELLHHIADALAARKPSPMPALAPAAPAPPSAPAAADDGGTVPNCNGVGEPPPPATPITETIGPLDHRQTLQDGLANFLPRPRAGVAP
jgi:Protein of unknown function (DUF3102)